MVHAMQILLNRAMNLERAEYLNASPYQRTEDRRGGQSKRVAPPAVLCYEL